MFFFTSRYLKAIRYLIANFKRKNKFFPCLTMSNTHRTSLGKLTICYGWPYYYIGLYNVMCIQINGKSSVSKINYCNNIKWFLSFNMFGFFMVFNDTFNNSASSLKQQTILCYCNNLFLRLKIYH
jgi:hypothetical protein